ncbi:MAG TPA: polysaccharide deacetylase [Methylomirabilota bacterium]|jgi:peptidoglycan/xylan/chitin deacetylase (PgdA/CDA1 family)|nr:polysaccharide deacetylase [Methylomirabilota bacterium]
MRYPWPDGKQCAVVLSFDFDAESGFLFREPEKAKRSLGDLEERRFGPRVGVDRILRMLGRLKLPASFFIPGWTVEHHLPESQRIRDAGHEIGAHGDVHEALGFLERDEEEGIMRRQLAILERDLGVRPIGYRSPSWDVNVWTPGILKAHGFLYDSSLMGNDLPYEVETEQGALVEVPVQWLLDDAPLFRHVYGATNAIADPGRVLQMWSKEFAAMHAENGCFVLTCHPFISGRASRIAMLEELVSFMRRFRGVWFTTCEGVARWHAERKEDTEAAGLSGRGRSARTSRRRRATTRRRS